MQYLNGYKIITTTPLDHVGRVYFLEILNLWRWYCFLKRGRNLLFIIDSWDCSKKAFLFHQIHFKYTEARSRFSILFLEFRIDISINLFITVSNIQFCIFLKVPIIYFISKFKCKNKAMLSFSPLLFEWYC